MRLTTVLRANVNLLLDYYSTFNPSPLSIKKFMDFGQQACEKKSFIFLRKELPVRLANIMKEFSLLPEDLLRMPSVMTVQSWYLRSFEDILEFEKIKADSEKNLEDFCEALIKIRNRHSNVVQTMAQGVIELLESKQAEPEYGCQHSLDRCSLDSQTTHSIEYFLNRFLLNRVSIRMLINQHCALFASPDLPGHGRNHIGCIDPNCDVTRVVVDAFENAKFLCDQYYLRSPEMVIETKNADKIDAPISIVYVPSHLYHMAFELIKNSMRAVVETHMDTNDLPPLRILLVKGKEDLTIKISDCGGGIPRSLMDKLFLYMYSTAPRPSVSDNSIAPIAGFGYGLPVSRLYARYLQGDIVLSSIQNHGTDAYIYLKVLSNEANEVLPVFNRTSSRNYRTHAGKHDYQIGNTT